MRKGKDPLTGIVRHMGEASYHILQVLNPAKGIPGIEILRRLEEDYREAGYPDSRVDPTTVLYAIKRMEKDGLVRNAGEELVDVRGPRGVIRPEMRPVYVITGLGQNVLDLRARLDQVKQRWALVPRAEGGQA